MMAFRGYNEEAAAALSLLELVSSSQRRFVNCFLKMARCCSRRWPGLDFCTRGTTECELLTHRRKDHFLPRYLACNLEKGMRNPGW